MSCFDPDYVWEYHTYKEGLADAFHVVGVTTIIAVISVILAVIIGIRKKEDCITIFVTNIMVKTVVLLMMILFTMIDGFRIILLFILTNVIEGLIYKRVLKYKKHSEFKIALISNLGNIAVFIFSTSIYRLFSVGL